MPTFYTGLGTEDLVDDMDIIFREKLNDALEIQQAIGDERDANRAARINTELLTVELEMIPPENFHVGSLPSFIRIDDKVEGFPLLATVPGRTAPDGEDAMADQYSIYQNAVSIHSFARANPQEGPEIAYRRAMRMAEAVHQVVCTDPLMRKTVAGISGPLAVDRSEPWYFPSNEGHGDEDDMMWCWYAVMHTYQIKNYSRMPQEV